MKTTDIPFLRQGDAMPSQSEPKTEPRTETKVTKAEPVKSGLLPAAESSSPEVHNLLAELETARANGAEDDARDLVRYLAELGYAAS
jgi:hypothetical protein